MQGSLGCPCQKYLIFATSSAFWKRLSGVLSCTPIFQCSTLAFTYYLAFFFWPKFLLVTYLLRLPKRPQICPVRLHDDLTSVLYLQNLYVFSKLTAPTYLPLICGAVLLAESAWSLFQVFASIVQGRNKMSQWRKFPIPVIILVQWPVYQLT